MDKIHDFLMAPTPAQKNEILLLCNKGQSESYFTCYIGPIFQAIPTLAQAAFDVLAEPVKGIKNACFICIECDSSSFDVMLDGFIKGLKSLVQVAVIVSAVVIGLFIPRIVYSSLEGVNTTTGNSELSLLQAKPDGLNEKYNELRIAKKAIGSELTYLKASNATLETNYSHQVTENIKLTQEIAAKNQEIHKTIKEKEELQLKYQQEIKGLATQLNDIQSELSLTKKKMEEQANILIEKEQDLSTAIQNQKLGQEREDVITAHVNEIESQKSEILSLQNALKTLVSSHSETEKKLKQEVGNWSEKHTAAEKNINEYQELSKQYLKQMTVLQCKNNRLRKQVEELTKAAQPKET